MEQVTKPVTEVAHVAVTYQAPKELNDVRLALTGLVHDIRAGKSATELLSGNLAAFMEAVKGYDQLPVELKEDLHGSLETVGHMGGCIAACLLSPKSAVPTA